MATRLPPLLDRAILFAHRGARASARAHPNDSFESALRLGATGLHVDAWATSDGHVVVSRDGLARRLPRRRIRDVAVADVPESLTRLEEIYRAVGAATLLSVAIDSAPDGKVVVEQARAVGAAESLWLAHGDLDVLAELRDHAPEIRLVNTTTLGRLPLGPERRAAELAAARVDAVLLPESDWSGGMVTLFHRFEVFAFAAGAQYERQLARVIDMGIDAVISDHADRMEAVAATFE